MNKFKNTMLGTITAFAVAGVSIALTSCDWGIKSDEPATPPAVENESRMGQYYHNPQRDFSITVKATGVTVILNGLRPTIVSGESYRMSSTDVSEGKELLLKAGMKKGRVGIGEARGEKYLWFKSGDVTVN